MKPRKKHRPMGRPRLPEKVRAVSVTGSIPPDFARWIVANGHNGSVSDGLRVAWRIIQKAEGQA